MPKYWVTRNTRTDSRFMHFKCVYRSRPWLCAKSMTILVGFHISDFPRHVCGILSTLTISNIDITICSNPI